MKFFLLTTLAVASVVSAVDIGDLGGLCGSANDCGYTGAICVKDKFFASSCPKGICGCPSNTLYNSNDKKCQSLTYPKVEDSCVGDQYEVPPTFSQCSGGTISCLSGYSANTAKTACTDDNPTTNAPSNTVTVSYEAECGSNDANGKMQICNTNAGLVCTSAATYYDTQRCRCSSDSYTWDAGTCRKRVWGDICRDGSNDCEFVGSGAYCRYGLCRCRDGTEMADYTEFNFVTGAFDKRSGCVATNTMKQGLNETCGHGFVDGVGLECAEGLACYKCQHDDLFRDIDNKRCRIPSGSTDPGAQKSTTPKPKKGDDTEYWFRRLFEHSARDGKLNVMLSAAPQNVALSVSTLVVAAVLAL